MIRFNNDAEYMMLTVTRNCYSSLPALHGLLKLASGSLTLLDRFFLFDIWVANIEKKKAV